MKTLHIDLGERSYDIRIASGLLDRAGEELKTVCPKAKRLAVVTDSNVMPLYAHRLIPGLEQAGFETALFEIPAGEKSKNAERLAWLWENLMDFGLTRTDAVVALGGGVVGDLAGFAAATVLRGVDFIQIPTTLLAQVDSSVGGKVAIDLAHGKNLAGAFWQPKLVLMDPDTLNTLPDETFSDGMAEVIKYGCITDKDFFETWTHGQAVAAGMCAALRLGLALGVTESGEGMEELTNLLQAFGLPLHISCPREVLEQAVGLDKKNTGSQITVILLKEMGKAQPVKLEREGLLRDLEPLLGA